MRFPALARVTRFRYARHGSHVCGIEKRDVVVIVSPPDELRWWRVLMPDGRVLRVLSVNMWAANMETQAEFDGMRVMP